MSLVGEFRMIVGYARTSTRDQIAGLEGQLRDLRIAGAETIYQEQVSSVAERNQLEEALRFVRKGDTLIVTKPDRLARSTQNLLSIVDDLNGRDVGLIVISMGGQQLDTRTATGKLMITMLAAIAAFEREIMLERQRDGIAKAAAEGKYKGRKPTAIAKTGQVLALIDAGELTRTEIAQTTGIGIASLYRIQRARIVAGRKSP
jgi:DNA invertase Pin-like site-specific DNA recombinase